MKCSKKSSSCGVVFSNLRGWFSFYENNKCISFQFFGYSSEYSTHAIRSPGEIEANYVARFSENSMDTRPTREKDTPLTNPQS